MSGGGNVSGTSSRSWFLPAAVRSSRNVRALIELEGDRVLLVGARLRLEDVVDAVVVGVDAGQERGPGRPGVRGDRGAEDLALALVEEGLEVGQGALLQQGVEDAPVGAIPRDQDHS